MWVNNLIIETTNFSVKTRLTFPETFLKLFYLKAVFSQQSNKYRNYFSECLAISEISSNSKLVITDCSSSNKFLSPQTSSHTKKHYYNLKKVKLKENSFPRPTVVSDETCSQILLLPVPSSNIVGELNIGFTPVLGQNVYLYKNWQ